MSERYRIMKNREIVLKKAIETQYAVAQFFLQVSVIQFVSVLCYNNRYNPKLEKWDEKFIIDSTIDTIGFLKFISVFKSIP